jgi:hypothetical protein
LLGESVAEVADELSCCEDALASESAELFSCALDWVDVETWA